MFANFKDIENMFIKIEQSRRLNSSSWRFASPADADKGFYLRNQTLREVVNKLELFVLPVTTFSVILRDKFENQINFAKTITNNGE